MRVQSVKVKFAYPERLSRGQLLLKSLFGLVYILIPHAVCLGVLGCAGIAAGIAAWFAVLVTGKYPRPLFHYKVGLLQWSLRVCAHLNLLCDGYPPCDFTANYPVNFSAEYPAKLSRGLLLLRTFLGAFYVVIPHGICLFARLIAHGCVSIVAWWAILFTGRIPAGIFSFMTGTLRWCFNVSAYLCFLTDEYPAFSGKAEGVQINASVAA